MTKEVIKTDSAVIGLVDKYASKAEQDTLKTIKAIAKTAKTEGISVRELSEAIKQGLRNRATSLKPTHAQNIQLMSLVCDLDGAPQDLGAINYTADSARKAWGTEKASEYLEQLKGKALSEVKLSAEARKNLGDASDTFQAIRNIAKAEAEAKAEANKRKARPDSGEGKGSSEGAEVEGGEVAEVKALPIDAQVIALAVALTQYAQAEGAMTANLRKALDKLEVALADFAI